MLAVTGGDCITLGVSCQRTVNNNFIAPLPVVCVCDVRSKVIAPLHHY